MKECVSLSKAGYDVFLVEQGDSEDSSGVHIVGTGERKPGRYYRLLIRPWKVYQLAKEVDADVYHFHDMELIPYGLALKKKGKKVVFDYHEDYASSFAESDALPSPKWLKKFLAACYCKYEDNALKKFDAVVSVTPHVCNRLKKQNENTYMITNYPLLDRDGWEARPQYDAHSDYIAFAGQISETYRTAFLTESIQDIPDIRLKLCGLPRKKDDIDRIKAVDRGNKMEYLGVLPYHEVPAFLSHARASVVLVAISANTGGKLGTFGSNKLFESMLCGVPVICADFVLWKDIIEKYKCGICVNPYSHEEIKNAVTYLLAHPDEAAEMGRNGRRAVLEEYNWDSQERVLLSMYRELGERGGL